MFCYYVLSNPNHSELLIGSIRDLFPNTHCLLYYFLICRDSVFKFAKGQELEITFSLFSVYFGVEAITLWGSFSYLIRGKRPARSVCAEWDMFHRLSCPGMALYCDSSLGIFVCSGLIEILHHVLQQLIITSSLMT